MKAINVILHMIFGITTWLSGIVTIGALIFASVSYFVDKPTDFPLQIALYAGVVCIVALILTVVNLVFLYKEI